MPIHLTLLSALTLPQVKIYFSQRIRMQYKYLICNTRKTQSADNSINSKQPSPETVLPPRPSILRQLNYTAPATRAPSPQLASQPRRSRSRLQSAGKSRTKAGPPAIIAASWRRPPRGWPRIKGPRRGPVRRANAPSDSASLRWLRPPGGPRVPTRRTLTDFDARAKGAEVAAARWPFPGGLGRPFARARATRTRDRTSRLVFRGPGEGLTPLMSHSRRHGGPLCAASDCR